MDKAAKRNTSFLMENGQNIAINIASDQTNIVRIEQITSESLNWQNYLTCSRAAEMYIFNDFKYTFISNMCCVLQSIWSPTTSSCWCCFWCPLILLHYWLIPKQVLDNNNNNSNSKNNNKSKLGNANAKKNRSIAEINAQLDKILVMFGVLSSLPSSLLKHQQLSLERAAFRMQNYNE